MGEGSARLARGFPGRTSASARIGGLRCAGRGRLLPRSPETNLPQQFPPLPRAKIIPSPSSPRRENNFRSGRGVTAAERATTPPTLGSCLSLIQGNC